MDQRQQELRQFANQAFMESLSQLGQRLTPAENATATDAPAKDNLAQDQPTPPVQAAEQQVKPRKIDLSELEEAAADIERFIESIQSEAD